MRSVVVDEAEGAEDNCGVIMLVGRDRSKAESRFRVLPEALGGVEDERGTGSGVSELDVGGEVRGTSVVWTTPCTTTSVPGGGNCRFSAGSSDCGTEGDSGCVAGGWSSDDGPSNWLGLITTSSRSSDTSGVKDCWVSWALSQAPIFRLTS